MCGRVSKLFAIAVASAELASAFYLPGVAPREYPDNTEVELKVNKLTSSKAQLPFGYYTLPYCRPDTITVKAENLGEILMGDEIENSPYKIYMNKNETCKLLCKVPLDDKKREQFRNAIDDEYMVNWIVDNMPAATRYVVGSSTSAMTSFSLAGFPVGVLSPDGKYLVHNHVRITLLSHTNPGVYKDYRIVGFEVEPFSMTQATLQNEDGSTQVMCQDGVAIQEFRLRKNSEIIFTYDVRWVDSPIRWASRWDSYLQMSGGQIHWFSIMNSLMIVLCLSVMIAMILLRTLYRDIAKYNEIATDEEAKEETGWKLVHGDVFREPANSDLLVVSVGSGVQLFCMVVVTLICALFGLLSPARRGVLLQSMMILFTLMGVIGGYAMSRFYKLFLKNNWKRPTIMTAVLYPGVVFIVFFLLNLMIWEEKSSGAVPFTTMFAMLALWFGVSVPLVFVGAYVGFGQAMIELPVRVSKIPRTVPEQSFYNNSILTSMAGGILPFGAVFTEMFFIMSSIWQHQFYYLFGFLALVLVILIVTCAEISIALTYFQLTAEDHRWWWRSFTTSGSAGVYLFLNAILYYNTRLNITHAAGTILYFGYMGVMSLCFTLLTGSLGFIASFLFVRAIYGSIKID